MPRLHPLLLLLTLLLLDSVESFLVVSVFVPNRKTEASQRQHQQQQQHPQQRQHQPYCAILVEDGDGSEKSVLLNQEQNIQRVSDLLKAEIGLEDEHKMSRIVKRATSGKTSSILTLSNGTLLQRIHFFQNKDGPFGFSKAGIQKIVVGAPNILNRRKETLISKCDKLCDILGVVNQQDRKKVLRKIVLGCPIALTISEENVKSKLNNLLHFFGDDKQTVQKVITRAPTLLNLAQDTVDARIEWLLNFLDGDEKVARRVAKVFPALLLLSEENMEAKIQNLSQFFGNNNNNEDAVRRAVVLCPTAVLGLSTETLNAKLSFLVEHVYGGDVVRAQDFVAKCPPVLSKRTETVKLKAAYLMGVVYKNNQKVFLAAISTHPTVLGTSSLEKRIKPRIEAVLRAGLDPQKFSLGCMIQYTEDRFDAWLERRTLDQAA